MRPRAAVDHEQQALAPMCVRAARRVAQHADDENPVAWPRGPGGIDDDGPGELRILPEPLPERSPHRRGPVVVGASSVELELDAALLARGQPDRSARSCTRAARV